MRQLVIAAIWLTAIVCADDPHAAQGPARQSGHTLQRIENARLPNAYRIADKVISGGQPDGEQAFADLAALGVKTIISVDGARPAVDLAAKYGLRYVHLPHGYDGIPDEHVKLLAKAVRDLPGPIYIHCHHGQHRSPAASAVASVAIGLIRPDAAIAVLRTAGTSENYRGLYHSAAAARRLDDQLLDDLAADFPSTVRLPPIAGAMVEIERTHDRLKALAANEWRRLDKQPDLDPAHESLLLKEHFRELLRADDIKRQPIEFQLLVRQSEKVAQSLEAALRDWAASAGDARPPESISKSMAAVSQSCTACHGKYRDVPIGEKSR